MKFACIYLSAILPSEFFSPYKSHYFTFLFKKSKLLPSTYKVSFNSLVWHIRANPDHLLPSSFLPFYQCPTTLDFRHSRHTSMSMHILFSTRNSIPYPITIWQILIYLSRPNSLDTFSLPISASHPPSTTPVCLGKVNYALPDFHFM